MTVDPDANVCREFATLGYCRKGADCAERHVFECPDYANTGSCPDSNCHLPHVDRAWMLRKLAGVDNAPAQRPGGLSDSSSSGKPKGDEDEIDSDDLKDSTVVLSADSNEAKNASINSFSQQQDFIGFD